RRDPVRDDHGIGRRQDGRRHGLGQGRRLDRHDHGLHRRERRLLLPAATDHDRKMAHLVRNNCTSCHTPSYPLQHRFDTAGWTAIIDLMKVVNVSGVYQGEKAKPNGLLEFNEKDLAAYLAGARGPGESTMKIKLPPRPSGEAARVVGREYDVSADAAAPARPNDGHDWSLGTPSRIGAPVHDAWSDLDGNLWFTSNTPNKALTIGRIDTKTGR